MLRPVRPVALVILTACALYPGLTFLFQGIYPFWTGEFFQLGSQYGPWMDLGLKLGLPVWIVSALKTLIGLAWLAGVPGLWAGDQRAWPVVVLAAAGSVLYPVGPTVMGLVALVVLFAFREKSDTVPA